MEQVNGDSKSPIEEQLIKEKRFRKHTENDTKESKEQRDEKTTDKKEKKTFKKVSLSKMLQNGRNGTEMKTSDEENVSDEFRIEKSDGSMESLAENSSTDIATKSSEHQSRMSSDSKDKGVIFCPNREMKNDSLSSELNSVKGRRINRRNFYEELKEEDELDPDLPVYEDQNQHHLNRMSYSGSFKASDQQNNGVSSLTSEGGHSPSQTDGWHTVMPAEADSKERNKDSNLLCTEGPYIKVRPRDQTINAGEAMQVECWFTVMPFRFEWYRGIIPIKIDPRAKISFDEQSLHSTLELEKCKMSDEAEYSIQVEDREGECLEIAAFTLSVRDYSLEARTKRGARKRSGILEEADVSQIQTEQDQPLPSLRPRRMSTVDLSRSAQRLSRMSSWSVLLSRDGFTSPIIDQVYSNPEMEIFRQRRLSQKTTRRRNSLAELIPDWPTLDYIEKPEYRMPEFKEDVLGEAQTLELRKMDPASIFKANHWIEELQDQTCQEKGAKVELFCLYSEQNVKLHWFKNTLEIFHGHKYNFISEDGLFRLVIQRVTREDSGKYTCQADDKQTSAYLTVTKKKKVPTATLR